MSDNRVGIGPTAGMPLRVSVATLSRVIFRHPIDSSLRLALEHKATLKPGSDPPDIAVRVQPFGGAARILKPEALLGHIGSFNFDSERSRAEQDFRVFIKPESWEDLLEACLQAPESPDRDWLEIDPSRELHEEFTDAMGSAIQPDQYALRWLEIVVENETAPTENPRAPGFATSRIYWTYEVEILVSGLCLAMLDNHMSHPVEALREKALEDFNAGGRGRANAIWVTPWDSIHAFYRGLSPQARADPVGYEDAALSGNVVAVLEGISTTKFRNVR